MFRPLTVYCSEIAALLGLNRFNAPTDAWDKVFQRSFKLQETSNQQNANLGQKITMDISSSSSSSSSTLTSSEYSSEKETHVKEYTNKLLESVKDTATVEELEKKLDTEFIELKPETRLEIIEHFEKKSIAPEVVEKAACSSVRTTYGTEYESTGMDLFAEIFSTNEIVTDIKPRIRKINAQFQLYGKIDGMMDNEIVLEHKARTKRLFYTKAQTNLYENEFVQIQSYLFLFQKEQGYLIETYKRDVNYRTVSFDADFWESKIVSKLQFKDGITVENIRDYYFEKDSTKKREKLENLFRS